MKVGGTETEDIPMILWLLVNRMILHSAVTSHDLILWTDLIAELTSAGLWYKEWPLWLELSI